MYNIVNTYLTFSLSLSLSSPGAASYSGLAGREADIKDNGGVAGSVVDIAGRGVDEENLSIRSDSVT